MIKNLTTEYLAPTSIVTDNHKERKCYHPKCMGNPDFFPCLYFPGAQILHLFPCGFRLLIFKSALVSSLHIVATASTPQPHRRVLKHTQGITILFTNYKADSDEITHGKHTNQRNVCREKKQTASVMINLQR